MVLRRTVSYETRDIFFSRKGVWLQEKAAREITPPASFAHQHGY